MTARTRISTSAQASSNEKTLRAWIQRTNLEQVPTNQYGGASRSAILKRLNISRSTAVSNPRITELFASLDTRLLAKPKATALQTNDVGGIADPHTYCAELHRDKLRLEAQVRRLQWRDDTGRYID